jgi:excisionase family DNA binding protein
VQNGAVRSGLVTGDRSAQRGGTVDGMSTHTPTREGTVLLTPADAARMAQVSRETIYREIERGELRARHVGRQLRIDPADFRRYLEREAA